MPMEVRIPLKKWPEDDMLTTWRKVMFCNYGRAKQAKRIYRHRVRRKGKLELQRLEDEQRNRTRC